MNRETKIFFDGQTVEFGAIITLHNRLADFDAWSKTINKTFLALMIFLHLRNKLQKYRYFFVIEAYFVHN